MIIIIKGVYTLFLKFIHNADFKLRNETAVVNNISKESTENENEEEEDEVTKDHTNE